jgi:hypothetical protein
MVGGGIPVMFATLEHEKNGAQHLVSLPTPPAGQAFAKKQGLCRPSACAPWQLPHMVSGSSDMTDLPLV